MLKLILFTEDRLDLFRYYYQETRKYNIALDPLRIRKYDKEASDQRVQVTLERFDRNETGIYFIQSNNKIIGLVVLYFENPEAGYVRIEKLFIDKKYRGRGYGKDVLDLVENLVKEKEMKYLGLNVFLPNKVAYSLYKKQGFKERFTDMIKEL